MTDLTAYGPALTHVVTGDEYMEILLKRQAAFTAHIAEHGGGVKLRYPPLLEWFVRDADADFVRLPDQAPAPPKPTPKPRVYRTAASIRAELASVEARMAQVAGRTDYGDTAAANLSPNARSRAARTAGRKRFDQMDRDLATYTRLDQRRQRLAGRLRAAEARERLPS